MLRLAFSTRAGAVELACDAANSAALQRLRTRYSSAATVSGTTITVGIDDFLLNVGELAHWPSDHVEWQTELLALVEGNYADATTVDAELASQPGSAQEYAEIPTGDWRA